MVRFSAFRRPLLALGALVAGLQSASALSYKLADAELPGCKGTCPKVVVATGTIGQAEHMQLAAFLERAVSSGAVSQVLVIDSPGGFTLGGAYLGVLLRQLKMTVIVGRWNGSTITPSNGVTPGTCASACVLALSGGAARYFVPGSRVGVHRSHTGTTVLDPLTRLPVNATVNHEAVSHAHTAYFRQMGIDTAVVAKMDATPSERIYWFSEPELAKFRLARSTASTGKAKPKRQP
ncbi:MAG: hypothetical protein IOC59_08585 [Methylobacterium sp.]|nr:hypothetical protein [Methylobacterium sp.]MCA3604390.1 hypothetical protein [Methylobacterium sp.]MCA3615261.1 hypothetical protein [Methylobacterium sp.]MCA3624119.1 hypothetical protein [Methylobacterium sp.]